MEKTKKMAQIHNGHEYIERRIYKDNYGVEVVKVNGSYFPLSLYKDDKSYSVFVWLD